MLEKQKMTNKEKKQLSFYLCDDIKGTEYLEYLFNLNNEFQNIYKNCWKKTCIFLIPVCMYTVYLCISFIYKLPATDVNTNLSLLLIILLSLVLIITIAATTDRITDKQFLYYFEKKLFLMF